MIPDVIKVTHKTSSFLYYIDLDVKNAFHQVLLEQGTSEMLSVQTQWGLYRPLFLPEGVTPASMVLMRIMYDMFPSGRSLFLTIFLCLQLIMMIVS
jgi:hypothetical protein